MARFLITQGRSGRSLVAGKQCLVRLFLPSRAAVDAVTDITVRVELLERRGFPTGNIASMTTRFTGIIREYAAPVGPSVGVIVRGCLFPFPGLYDISINATGDYQFDSRLGAFSFNNTNDVRLRFVPYYMSNQDILPTNWDKEVAGAAALLSAIWPVRDGVGMLGEDSCSGIRYLYDAMNPVDSKKNWEAPHDQFMEPTMKYNALNRDYIDITILFRMAQPADPGAGGSADVGRTFKYAGQFFRYARPVGDKGVAAGVCAHEIGHTMGMEEGGSPYRASPQDAHSSLDLLPVDPYEFDFFSTSIPVNGSGDVMGFGWYRSSMALNDYDWDWLLRGLDQVPLADRPTGPRTHPCPCLLPKARPEAVPSDYFPFVGSKADGPAWQMGPRGIGPVPGRDPLFRLSITSHPMVNARGLRCSVHRGGR